MKIKAAGAVLLQLVHPERAYGFLCGGEQSWALAGTATLILFIGFLPFLVQGGTSPDWIHVPLLIAAERVLLSAAAALSVYALSYALGDRKPLWTAFSSSFMSMGAFMVFVAVLTLFSYLFSLPLSFTWSPAELLLELPATRLSMFVILFTSRLDLASIATVFLWGRGLSAVWKLDGSTGQRLAWTVYLFGILLLSLPVFIAAPGGEGTL